MKIKGVDFVLYNVADYKKAVSFYRDVLGLKQTDDYKGYWAEFEVGKVVLALRAPHGKAAFDNTAGGGAAVALAVEDVKAGVEELRNKGVTIMAEPDDGHVCVKAQITDPDGNRITLHQRKDGTAG